MSASPEFFSPACATPLVFGDGYDDDCRTPTGNRISYLGEATTCPPAPRKKPPPPPPCRKRLLFQGAQLQAAGDQLPAAESSFAVVVPIISLRLDELERLFRPQPPPPTTDGAAPVPAAPSSPTNTAQLELPTLKRKQSLKIY